MGKGIPVKLQVFEGPLDLLLHLIDKNKIDIYDIPIVGDHQPVYGIYPGDGQSRPECHE